MGAADPSLIAGNALTLDQQSNEGASTTWAVNTNCTLATTNAQAYDASQALGCTVTAAATAKFTSPTGTPILIPRWGKLHAEMWSRAAVTGRSIQIYGDFYNNGGFVRTFNNSGVTNNSTGWTKHTWDFTLTSATSSIINAVVFGVQINSPGAGEVLYFDRFYLAFKTTYWTSWPGYGLV